MPDQYGNPTATDFAGTAAQNAYYQAQARGADAAAALAEAKFAWEQKMNEATQTGMWNGQWSNPQEQWFTGQFGQWFGPGGAPSVGQQTLNAQNQQFTQGQGLGAMYGQYYAPGTGPAAGTQTQAALQQAQTNAYTQAGLTGWYTPTVNNNVSPSRFNYDAGDQRQAYLDAAQGDANLAAQRWAADQSNAVAQFNAAHPQQAQQTLQGQQQQWNQAFQQQNYEAQQRQLAQTNTLAYLKQLADLRGPADWAKYQQVLGSTPQGMRDLYAAAMGQYTPGGGATTGVQPQAVDLNTMQQQIAGYNPQAQAQGGYVWGGGGQQPGGGPTDVYNQYWNADRGNQYTPQGQTQPNYYASQYANGGQGQAQQQAGGQWQDAMYRGSGQQAQNNEVWGSGLDQSRQQTAAQQQQATGNGANMMGAQQQQYRLPAPNQVAPQSWNNLTPSQQQMMLGDWESQGYYKPDVEALYKQSLPKYAQNNATAGTWRMK